MRKRVIIVGAVLGGLVLVPGVANAGPDPACWGQASSVFARSGMMGEHARSFETPRLGLRNLARSLHQSGVLEDDSMQALGAFVASELGLEIDACD